MKIKRLNISQRQLEDIGKKYLIRELSVFGSVLRKDFNEACNIDLFVEFEPNFQISLFDIVDLRDAFKKLFGREVDIVSKIAIQKSKNYIKQKAILKNYRVIYAS